MKIRVCHIITKLELGGAQQNTLYTLSHLDPARFEPILVTGSEGILVEEGRRAVRRTHLVAALRREISPLRDLSALRGLVGILRSERPDIVHTHSSKAGILGRWAASLSGVGRIVHSIHGYGFHPGQPRLLRESLVALERITGRLTTTAFVAVSRANLRTGLELDLYTPDRVTLIRSGIRLSDFSPRTEGLDGDRPVTVGMVACLKPQKAPLDFVRVAARVVREAGAPVRFVLVGDGEMRPQVDAMIRAEGIEEHVSLEGWRRDVPELMRRLDLLIHTSLWEGLPRVFPEAMATGLPIVATRVDGAPEAIEEGVTGYLLEPGDVAGLARATIELVRDPALRRRMGQAALARTAPWDIDGMVRRQERLYEGLMAGETARAVSLSTQMEG
ncbi:MAG TPA: glycosyltransferase family 4 protein [Candidatus Polarisedimenticolia bacterium]|jgi:glycosyltransferase involved in cell wall biosynthesis